MLSLTFSCLSRRIFKFLSCCFARWLIFLSLANISMDGKLNGYNSIIFLPPVPPIRFALDRRIRSEALSGGLDVFVYPANKNVYINQSQMLKVFCESYGIPGVVMTNSFFVGRGGATAGGVDLRIIWVLTKPFSFVRSFVFSGIAVYKKNQRFIKQRWKHSVYQILQIKNRILHRASVGTQGRTCSLAFGHAFPFFFCVPRDWPKHRRNLQPQKFMWIKLH